MEKTQANTKETNGKKRIFSLSNIVGYAPTPIEAEANNMADMIFSKPPEQQLIMLEAIKIRLRERYDTLVDNIKNI